jgi:hypothetical protein
MVRFHESAKSRVLEASGLKRTIELGRNSFYYLGAFGLGEKYLGE